MPPSGLSDWAASSAACWWLCWCGRSACCTGRGRRWNYLNKFKQVNDTYGHEAGDKVLCAFVAAVTRYVDTRHLFARMGGDEFVLIFPPGTEREEVDKTLAGIRQTCAEPLELSPGERVCIEFACGLAFWPEGEDSFQAVLRQADAAMYRDKKR